MKKIAALLTAAVLLAALSGCDRDPVPADTTAELPPETTAAATQPSQAAPETTVPAPSETVAETTEAPAMQAPEISVQILPREEITPDEDNPDVKLMTYRWQDIQVSAPNGVGQQITTQLLDAFTASQKAAAQLLETAKNDYTEGRPNWQGYSYELALQIRRIDSQVISFSGNTWSFSGGVHPNQVLVSTSFDALTGNPIILEDLFVDSAAEDAVFQQVLEQLSMDDSLYPEYEDTVRTHFDSGNPASGCFYFQQTGLSFYFSPYEIAPYARGSVEITLPYSQLDGLLNDCWMPAALPAVFGTMQVSDASEAQVVIPLEAEAPQVVLQAAGDVTELVVYRGEPYGMSTRFVPVYSAPVVADGTRIALAIQPDSDRPISISFRAGSEIQVLDLVRTNTGYILSD